MMKKKRAITIGILLLACTLFTGCSEKNSQQESAANAETPVEGTASDRKAENALPDGIYEADFNTDSGMFHASEACNGKGTLYVENGRMTIHVSLESKKIVNLYCGLAEAAAAEDAELLEPTVDTVTYSDGYTEEVYGFDIPVPALDEEFDLALIGTKGKWYDHKVSVSDPQPLEENQKQTENSVKPENGTYTIELTFEGGSGKASVASPAVLTVEDENMTATLEWSSPNYDYMIVAGETYLPVNTEGNSVFEIPVTALDEPIEVIGDTVAMSTPHEIEYTLTFHSDTLEAAE